MVIDVEALRGKVRAMRFEPGTLAEREQWQRDDHDSRANSMLEGIRFKPDEEALFAMLIEEGVPPALTTKIVLEACGLPDAA